jgi:hypothetical protein
MLGDLKRAGKIDADNKFNIETLPDSYDTSIGTVELSNGYLLDKKLDQQAMILLDKKANTVILCFRGTDAGAGMKSAVLDIATTMAGWHPFKTTDETITSNGKVHIGMQKSWKR